MALEKLELAEQKVVTAEEDLADKTDKVREAQVEMLIQMGPAAITAVSSFSNVMKEMGITATITAASIKGLAITVGEVVAALTAGAVMIWLAYEAEVSGAMAEARQQTGLFGKAAGKAARQVEQVGESVEETIDIIEDLEEMIDVADVAFTDVAYAGDDFQASSVLKPRQPYII